MTPQEQALWANEIQRMCLEQSDGDTVAALLAAEYLTSIQPFLGGLGLSVDAQGLEHRGKGEGGGQFVSSSSTSNEDDQQKRAKKGGEYGPNGEWYKGGAWIATTDMPKKQRQKLERIGKTTGIEIEPGVRTEVKGGMLSIYSTLKPGVAFDPRTMTLNESGMAYMQYTPEERKQAAELLDRYKKGERQVPLADYWLLSNYSDMARAALAKYPIPDECLGRMAKWRGESVDELKANLGLVPYSARKNKALSIEAMFGNDIANKRAQTIINRAMAFVKDMTADAKRDLGYALKRQGEDGGQAILNFVDKYRVKMARLLTAVHLATHLEGMREVAVGVPTVATFPGAVAPPPTLEPKEAIALVEKLFLSFW
jgi:hypothetical protein